MSSVAEAHASSPELDLYVRTESIPNSNSVPESNNVIFELYPNPSISVHDDRQHHLHRERQPAARDVEVEVELYPNAPQGAEEVEVELYPNRRPGESAESKNIVSVQNCNHNQT